MKKTLVLVILFVFPLVAYLFFASGVHHFGRLPVLSEDITDLRQIDPSQTFQGKITILGFLGGDPSNQKVNAFNLNEKIYKPFYEFHDFQMVMVLPTGTQEAASDLKRELGRLVDTRNWKFVFGQPDAIRELFDSMKTNIELDDHLYTPYVFIIDKEGKLRGRKKDEDEGTKYGFDAVSVADISNKMEDDVKVILAEYRLELKKNNAQRSK